MRRSVVHEGEQRSRVKLTHLHFEDFLEALVRMATIGLLALARVPLHSRRPSLVPPAWPRWN